MLKNIETNIDSNKIIGIKLFEIGKIFKSIRGNISESTHLGMIGFGQTNGQNWITPNNLFSFFCTQRTKF